jgi:hypothetical protein
MGKLLSRTPRVQFREVVEVFDGTSDCRICIETGSELEQSSGESP